MVDEACTLAKLRAETVAALSLLQLLDTTSALDMEWIGPERFERAKATFRRRRDQSFSFTDCTSFAVMRELLIADAVTTTTTSG